VHRFWYNSSAQVYAIYSRPGCFSGEALSIPSTKFFVNLHYNVHEVDVNTGEEQEEGDPDESKLDEVEFGLSDYVSRTTVADWNEAWNQYGDDAPQGVSTFKKPGSASAGSPLTQAANEMLAFLGMNACAGSAKIPPGETKHIMFLSGSFVDVPTGDPVPILGRIRMRFMQGQGVVLELVIRCKSEELAQLIANAIFS